jgi:hypothetical protein
MDLWAVEETSGQAHWQTRRISRRLHEHKYIIDYMKTQLRLDLERVSKIEQLRWLAKWQDVGRGRTDPDPSTVSATWALSWLPAV